MPDFSYFRGRQTTIDELNNKGPKRDPNEYRVSYKDGDGGIYQSVIRFIPIPDGITASNKDYMFKYVTWLTNPTTNEKRCIDNPTTVGDTKNQMDNLMWALLMSNNEAKKNIAKNYMRRTEQYLALIQVINDPKHPEYNNRIMYMRFGNSIHDKLVQELSPNQSLGITYPSPFDIITGRAFNLVVTSKNGQNDYTQSRFLDSANLPGVPTGLRYVNAQGQTVAVTESTPDTEYPLINQYLLSQIANIDLARHEYKGWDESTSTFVNEALSVIAEYAQTGVLPQNDVLHQEAQTVSPTTFLPPQVAQTTAVPQTAPVYNPPTSVAAQIPQVPHVTQAQQTPVSAPVNNVGTIPVPPTAAAAPTTAPANPPQKTTGSRFGDLNDVIY